jgi:hypothetical protein
MNPMNWDPGVIKSPDPGSGVWLRDPDQDEQPGSYFRELRNNFLEWNKFGSRIQEKNPGTATL